jgi:hypothetical protein
MDTNEKLTAAILITRTQRDCKAKEVAATADWLSRRMTELAERARANDGRIGSPNLGNLPTQIEQGVAELNELNRTLERLEWIAKDGD